MKTSLAALAIPSTVAAVNGKRAEDDTPMWETRRNRQPLVGAYDTNKKGAVAAALDNLSSSTAPTITDGTRVVVTSHGGGSNGKKPRQEDHNNNNNNKQEVTDTSNGRFVFFEKKNGSPPVLKNEWSRKTSQQTRGSAHGARKTFLECDGDVGVLSCKDENMLCVNGYCQYIEREDTILDIASDTALNTEGLLYPGMETSFSSMDHYQLPITEGDYRLSPADFHEVHTELQGHRLLQSVFTCSYDCLNSFASCFPKETITVDDSPFVLNCRNYFSCTPQESPITILSFAENDKIYCKAINACQKLDISGEGSVFCQADDACQEASFSLFGAGTLSCVGMGGCRSTSVTLASGSTTMCSELACTDSTQISTGDGGGTLLCNAAQACDGIQPDFIQDQLVVVCTGDHWSCRNLSKLDEANTCRFCVQAGSCNDESTLAGPVNPDNCTPEHYLKMCTALQVKADYDQDQLDAILFDDGSMPCLRSAAPSSSVAPSTRPSVAPSNSAAPSTLPSVSVAPSIMGKKGSDLSMSVLGNGKKGISFEAVGGKKGGAQN